MVSAQDKAKLLEESADLVCVQLKGQNFENVFNKSDGDFQQLLCKNQIQRDVHCAKKYLDDNSVFDVFLYETFSFIFGRVLSFVKCKKKEQSEFFFKIWFLLTLQDQVFIKIIVI